MNLSESWEKALKETAVVRLRARPLETFSATQLPYVLLCESSVNPGDTAVRQGTVTLEKPAIMLPFGSPQFDGFDAADRPKWDWDWVTGFLLVRGVRFPSLKYRNETQSLSVFDGPLAAAVAHHARRLQMEEDLATTLVAGSEDAWPFSLLIFTGHLVARSAEGDARKIFDEYRRKDRWV